MLQLSAAYSFSAAENELLLKLQTFNGNSTQPPAILPVTSDSDSLAAFQPVHSQELFSHVHDSYMSQAARTLFMPTLKHQTTISTSATATSTSSHTGPSITGDDLLQHSACSDSASSPAYATLCHYRDSLAAQLQLLHSVQSLLQEITVDYDSIQNASVSLRQECESMLELQKALYNQANIWKQNLAYFESAGYIAQQLKQLQQQSHSISNFSATAITSSYSAIDGSAVSYGSSTLFNVDFISLLNALDESIAYMRMNGDMADAPVYKQKLERLQVQLVRFIKQQFIAAINSVQFSQPHKGAQAAINAAAAPSATGQDDSSIVQYSNGVNWLKSYVVLRSTALQLRPLLRDIEQRSAVYEIYAELLNECQQHYYAARHNMLVDDIHVFIANLMKQKNLPHVLRSACTTLTELSALEYQAFYQFFSHSHAANRKIL